MIFPGTQGGPLMHVIAAKAVAFLEALQPEFVDYQQQVVANARAMATVLAGSAASRSSPAAPTTTCSCVDLIEQQLTGKDADAALGRAHITVNKNAVPNDPRSPFVTSGLRIGTPAVTTRGFKEAEVAQLADWIADVLDDVERRGRDRAHARRRCASICRRFPVYGLSAATGSRQEPADALPVLRARGDQGHRLAPVGRGPAGAPPPRVPAAAASASRPSSRPSSSCRAS